MQCSNSWEPLQNNRAVGEIFSEPCMHPDLQSILILHSIQVSVGMELIYVS